MLVLDMIYVDWIVKKEKFTGTLRRLSHALDPLGFGAWHHASSATSMDDILLNSSLVTPQNNAFKALLLKFATLNVSSSQSTGASLGLI